MAPQTLMKFLLLSLVLLLLDWGVAAKIMQEMEDFTFNVFTGSKASNIQQLKEEENLRETHSMVISLPDIDFDPEKETKEKEKIFKLITFEFAKTEKEDEEIPELGMTTFQITTRIKKSEDPKCGLNDTRGSNCPKVTRKSTMEFFSVPFEETKRFHRTYGQINGGFEGQNQEEYIIYHTDGSQSAAFDYPDNNYPSLGVASDVRIDLYNGESYHWEPYCNKKENKQKCQKLATCGAKIPGNPSTEKDVDFCCLCVPGRPTNSFPSPCGTNITARYEEFLSGKMEGCPVKDEKCPYNSNPMKRGLCAKTFGSCPITCKCGSPQDMHPCIFPLSKRPKYPLFESLIRKKHENGVKSKEGKQEDKEKPSNGAKVTVYKNQARVMIPVVINLLALTSLF